MLPRPSPPALDAAALARLLLRLETTPERAGEAYEDLRRALLRFFEWRGVPGPDAAADETLDRVARRVAEADDVADVRAFTLGVARFVALERKRRPEARFEPIDAALGERLVAPGPSLEPDERERCFEQCFERLPADQRTFIVTYYGDSGRARIDQRAALARDLALTPNALRLRAQRIRDRLEACIGHCQRAADGGNPRGGAPL